MRVGVEQQLDLWRTTDSLQISSLGDTDDPKKTFRHLPKYQEIFSRSFPIHASRIGMTMLIRATYSADLRCR